ncbi:hypothetical protein T4B_2149 [Trichinella pseudospiralis]|uniref:Uncharacterized protein n=1 Tax=Trichinella pseudospiralis TaxID=6337 RepID=A0A0V1IGC0_TRIPS|nr:hypothetical protein T4B_2149 [Trichinella pseudospiralis]KRZ45089.1 hypothetical protein T4C_3548 [Trichinella pseudospiralis]
MISTINVLNDNFDALQQTTTENWKLTMARFTKCTVYECNIFEILLECKKSKLYNLNMDCKVVTTFYCIM